MSVVESPLKQQTRPSQKPNPNKPVPDSMLAAVYVGNSRIEPRHIATPQIGPGEILIRVESCGVCHTDLKKIEYNLLAPPRVYGHETAGVIAAVGPAVTKYAVGDRVVVFHHIPCGNCFYCERKLYAQCPVYKKVGVTAGFEPAGGGFAQYVRAMDWIVDRGIEKIPDGVGFDQACWVEPVNTCLKAVEQLHLHPSDVVAVLGQGPIGLLFTALVRRTQASVFSTDTLAFRREISERFGAVSFDPREPYFESALKSKTQNRGADAVILATNVPGLVEQAVRISRPGARILLFAQTSATERVEISGADICVGERVLFGSYSADIDLQRESARVVFSGEIRLKELISDCFPLSRIADGIALAQRPTERSLKIVIHPQEGA